MFKKKSKNSKQTWWWDLKVCLWIDRSEVKSRWGSLKPGVSPNESSTNAEKSSRWAHHLSAAEILPGRVQFKLDVYLRLQYLHAAN